jgi:hypothetical protein
MESKEDEKSLEEKAGEFFKSKIHLNFSGIHPIEIVNLDEYISSINYLVKKGYIMEKGDTVETFRYIATNEGLKWFDKLRELEI